MSPSQALQTVAYVVRQFKGTYDEHKVLDEALNLISVHIPAETKGEVEAAAEKAEEPLAADYVQ